jgi:SSS family solute:Na+ symporter
VPFAIDFQLLGGAIMIQVFPAFAVGLFTRWFDPRALLAGWGAGIAAALAMAVESGFSSNITLHAGGASLTGFIAFFAFFLNLGVATIGTAALRAGGSSIPTDHTSVGDYA